jgi:hypothetical protein
MDVIGTGHDRHDARVLVRRRPATGPGVPLIAGLAVTAVLLGFFAGRAERTVGLLGDGTTGDLTGSMVLELQSRPTLKGQLSSDQAEYRGEDWKGTITVDASDDHTGAARLRGSASYVPTDSGPVVAHMWGTAEVTLDGQSCTGTYGYSSYRDTDEGGGSIHLRCDEGTALGATMTADGVDPPSDDGARDWTITVALTEGYLLER